MNGTKLEQMQSKDKTAFVKSKETKAKFIRNRLYLFDQCADQCLIEIINTSKHANMLAFWSKRVKSSVSQPAGDRPRTRASFLKETADPYPGG